MAKDSFTRFRITDGYKEYVKDQISGSFSMSKSRFLSSLMSASLELPLIPKLTGHNSSGSAATATQ
jgi:hypothetical protein